MSLDWRAPAYPTQQNLPDREASAPNVMNNRSKLPSLNSQDRRRSISNAIASGLAAEAKSPTPRTPGIPRPASLYQEQLWFVHHLEGATSAYNEPLGLRISGSLNKSALEASLNRVIERHDVLRSRFEATGTTLTQTVVPGVVLRLEVAAIDVHLQGTRRV